MRVQRKGFALIEILIITGVIMAIGAFVYYALRPNPSPVVSMASPSPSAGTSNISSPTPTPKKEFVIKEWGVAFDYDGSPPGLYYEIEKSGDIEIAKFGATGLQNFAKQYDSSNWCDAGSLGLIGRKTVDPSTLNNVASPDTPLAHIGKYYFGYARVQNPCSGNSVVSDEQGRVTSIFIPLTASLRQE